MPDDMFEIDFSGLPDDVLIPEFQTLGEAMTINPTWAVFPCAPNSKEPWPGVSWSKKSRPRSEWRVWPEEANIGIDTGKSGLVIVDEDEPGAVEKWLGYEPYTYTVSTGKGTHYYFTGKGLGIRNSARKVAPGVDIRAEGGYVVGVGSTHPNGRRYAVVRNTPVAPLPTEIRTALADEIEIDLTEVGRFELPEVIPDGQRNETLFRYACSLVAKGREYDEALILLTAAFQNRCKPAYTETQPDVMLTRAFQAYGKAQDKAAGVSWGRLDLAEIVRGLADGTIERPKAEIGARADGECLFYAGRVNGLYGDSTAGKTWTALLCCAQQMDQGRTVVFIDFEDDEVGTVERLLALGVPAQAIVDQFAYLRPEERYSDSARAALLGLVAEIKPSLVVVDSTGESMAVDGTKPNDDDEVARWVTNLPKGVARKGPAVLLLDHLAKSNDGGLWPIGSQRKRAAITGAAYVQETVVGFAKGKAGMSSLKCSKDRRGGYATGEVVAELHVRPVEGDEDQVRVDLREPVDAEAVKHAKEAHLMDQVSRALADQHAQGREWVSTKVLRPLVKGNNEAKDEAASALVDEGYAERIHGKGYRLIKPFNVLED